MGSKISLYLLSSQSSTSQKPRLWGCWDKDTEEGFLGYFQPLRSESF